MEVSIVVSGMVDDEEWFDIDEKVDATFQDADDSLFISNAPAQAPHMGHISIHFRQGLLALGLAESVVAPL